MTASAGSSEPLPFSHKVHSALKLKCIYCHATAGTGARAGFPIASRCMVCHQQVAKDEPAIQRLSALAPDRPIVPKKPVYELPDFVIFTHARHQSEKISCSSCHGNVWGADVLKLQLPMQMKACVDCHKKHQATVRCTACHELSQ